MSSLFLVGLFIAFNFIICCEFKFTSSDFEVIAKFRRHFHSQWFVFVEDGKDVSLTAMVKQFEFLYFAVVDLSGLVAIFASVESQAKFFQRSTTLITKDTLNLTSLLDKASNPRFLSWIVFGDHTAFRELCIPVNSHVFFVHSTPETVLLKQVYHRKCGVNETVKTVDLQNTIVTKRMDFQRMALKMLFLTPRENCQKRSGQTLLRKMECVHWDINELMAEKLNFSIIPVECMEKEHPFTFPNGSDSELFLKIKHREVDFSALGHVISGPIRRVFMEFIWPTFILESKMYLKQGRLTGHWASYLKPLESSVWWGILVCILVFGILIEVCERLLNKSRRINFVLSLTMSGLRAVQVFCNQATPDMPTSWSIRFLYLLMFFVVLIFYQAYCGYLVSSLTVVAAHFPFLDLEGLFANPHYKVITLRRGFHQFYFRKVVGINRREDFILRRDELPETVPEALDKLCAEDHLAFAEFREDLLDHDKPKCLVSELPHPVLRLYAGIATPAGGPFREFFNRELMNLRSTGILKRFESRLSPQASQVLGDKRSLNEFSSVSMYQTFSVFVLLGAGMLLSIMAFVVEVMVKKTRTLRK